MSQEFLSAPPPFARLPRWSLDMVDIDQNGLEAAVRECARITAPDVTDEEFERERAEGSSRYLKTREEMSRAIGAYLSAQQREPVVREALDRFEARIEKYITQLNALGRADIAHLLRRDVDCLMAAIEIIPAGAGESSDGGVLDEQCGGGQTPYAPRRFDSGPSETHDGGPPEPSPLAVNTGPSDPASGRSQPSPDVSVDELAQFIVEEIRQNVHSEEGGIWINAHPTARALLARYRIERLDRLHSRSNRRK